MRISDDTEKVVSYQEKIIEIVVSVIISAIILFILFYINFQLALVSIIVLPFSFWITKYISVKCSNAYENLRQIQARCNSFLYDSLQNWKEIKVQNIQDDVLDEYDTLCKIYGKKFIVTHIYWFINRTIIAFKDVMITKMGLYLLGGLLIARGYSEVSILLVFLQYYEMLINQIIGISDNWVKLGDERESCKKVSEFLDVDVEKGEIYLQSIDSIEMRDVCFSYDNNSRNVLNEVNLRIDKFSKIGLFGKSGCGKSTLIKIIAGVENAKRGYVLINGYNIEEINIGSLYSKIGLIRQESYLFNLSIRDNLLLVKEDASDDELLDVCEKAKIKNFILQLENGLDTIIGENGIRLSGGQRQRLIIARMLLHDPDVILWDEATNALDSETECEIVNYFFNKEIYKTLILITHNVNLLENCRLIYSMDNGKIINFQKDIVSL